MANKPQPEPDHRQKAAHTAHKFLDLPNAAIFDIESTGLTIEDQAVEIAAIDGNGRVLLSSLLNPGYPVRPSAARTHGLSQLDVDSAPSTAKMEPKIRTALDRKALAAYNLPFALGTIQYTLTEAGFEKLEHDQKNPVCAMRLSAQWRGHWVASKQGYRWDTLENALKLANLKPPVETGALGHVRASLALLKFMASQYQAR